MIRMSTWIIIIRLLICTVIFVMEPCSCRGNANWYKNLYKEQIDEGTQIGFEIIESRYRSEDIILSNISHLTIGSPAHGQLIDSMPSKDGHLLSRNAEIAIEISQHFKYYCRRYYDIDYINCGRYLMAMNLTGTLGEMCRSEYNNSNLCIGGDLDYRSPDGSCNNLKRNYLGKANTAYMRLLPPSYTDGISEMPNFYEKELPNPRFVSTNLVKDEDSSDHTKTMMMGYWTMFIGHDLSHTAVSSMGTGNRYESCCDTDKNIQYTLNKRIKSCKPLYIPVEDRLCKPDPLNCLKCMNYVRSRPAMRINCTFGPLEQMNQATHYLDASMIYGTTEERMLSLREMSNGQLLVKKKLYHSPNEDLMPLETTDTKACQNGTGTCFRAGDIRANAFPPLTAMYTMWVREHNRIARKLYIENLFRNDEELFREAKKIVTACIQHITYNEWLPALLGVNYTKENGLGLEQRTVYNETADPSVSNSFATAILPFANSMITDEISANFTFIWPTKVSTYPDDESNTLKKMYNKPLLVSEKLEKLLKGLTVQATQKVDMLFTETITNYLYYMDPNYYSFGMDIVSLVIQRSRDHGIPSYTQFRKYCGLKDIENVQDLSEIMVEGSADRLLKLYKTWNDIDLFIGAMLEKHVDDAMVGPTMRCIIKEQFVRTRIADRYFYDVPGVFTDYQLENIRGVTLARVLCDSGGVGMMTQQVFSRPADYDRAIHHCNSTLIPEINFSGWFGENTEQFFVDK